MNKSIALRCKAAALTAIIALSTVMGCTNVLASTAKTGMRDISSLDLVKDMRVGWNLGNTFDGSPDETSWYNPRTSKAMIDKISEMGFKTLRLPVTWGGHMGSAPNYTIDKAWLDRVEEVANYAFENDMYVILNIHHENGWLKPTNATEAQSKAQLVKLWEQLSARFKDYGDYLIFETMNEPRVEGSSTEWSGGNYEYRDVINKFNLAAVNTIRASGGNNAKRHIMIPSHAACAIPEALDQLVIPNNDSRVIVSLHMYSPYSYTMDIKGTNYWGSATDKSSLSSEFDAVYNRFVRNGRAVVIGEWGTTNKDNLASRVVHAEYYVSEARKRGLTPVWWDNGQKKVGAENFQLFDRNSLTWTFPDIANAIIRGAGGKPNPTPTPVRITNTPTPSNTPTRTPTNPQNIRYGDVNNDNIVDSADFTLLRSYLIGKIRTLPNIAAADTNVDNVVDSADYTILQKFLIGRINRLPY